MANLKCVIEYHTESSRYYVHLRHQIVSLADSGATTPVEPNGMNFIDKRQSTKFMSNVTKFGERANGTGHRVNRLESDDLGDRWIYCAQKFTQVSRVVVAEDVTWNSTVSDALDHWSVISSIWENVAACKSHNGLDIFFISIRILIAIRWSMFTWDGLSQGEEGWVISDITGREH